MIRALPIFSINAFLATFWPAPTPPTSSKPADDTDRHVRDAMLDILSRCPEAMQSETGMMMAMSVYPREF